MVHEAGSTPDASQQLTRVREVVGVFRDETVLEDAIDLLLESGFDRAEISLLASEEAVLKKLDHVYRKVSELEDDDKAVRVAYVSKEDYGAAEGGLISGLVYVGALAGAGAVVASGGALGGALLAAGLWGGAGGAFGFLAARWLDRQRAQRLAEQIEMGGLLLWVHARDAEHEAKAIEILQRHRAEDVHAHDLTLAQSESAGATRVPHPPLLTLLESLRQRHD